MNGKTHVMFGLRTLDQTNTHPVNTEWMHKISYQPHKQTAIVFDAIIHLNNGETYVVVDCIENQ